MIQDIEPRQYHNEFAVKKPGMKDFFLYFEGNQVLMKKEKDSFAVMTFEDIQDQTLREQVMEEAEYLFCIDAFSYFSARDALGLMKLAEEDDSPSICDISLFRELEPQFMGFAGITASQIYRFRKSRKYCGKCGHLMEYGTVERSMCCPACGNVEYPKISPAVTVAVINGGRLLMAKSAAGSFRRFALIAGYVEIGETFEQTVHREVMEEVGLKVKNLQYYKSQPWAFSDTEMIGYFAELDGDDRITLQESELAEARWFTREEIGEYPATSLTYEMVNLFKAGKNPVFHADVSDEGRDGTGKKDI